MQYPVIRRTAVHTAVAALTLTALAACSSSSGGDRGTASAQTVATDPPTTTTTNPYAVPAVIDAAYVNRVLAGLDSLKGDATRDVIRSKTITVNAFDYLRAAYDSNEFLQLTVDGLEADVRENFGDYRPNPGNVSTTVSRLVSAGPTCIFAQVQRDYTSVGIKPSPDIAIQWVALRPLDRSRDPRGLNNTLWALAYDGLPRDRLQPRNPCAG